MKSELKTIYVMDDDSYNLEVAEVALTTVGQFEVKTFSRAALLLAEELPPDLILSDVKMPEIDGPTALGKIRERPDWKTIPIVFMTADTAPAELEELRTLGAAGILPKPIDPMKLAAELQAIWDGLSG